VWVNDEDAGAWGRTARRWISPGLPSASASDKHGAAALAERFGKFGRKLMADNDFDFLPRKRLSQQSGLACHPNASSLRRGLP